MATSSKVVTHCLSSMRARRWSTQHYSMESWETKWVIWRWKCPMNLWCLREAESRIPLLNRFYLYNIDSGCICPESPAGEGQEPQLCDLFLFLSPQKEHIEVNPVVAITSCFEQSQSLFCPFLLVASSSLRTTFSSNPGPTSPAA